MPWLSRTAVLGGLMFLFNRLCRLIRMSSVPIMFVASCASAGAAVQVGATRVIFQETNREASLPIKNGDSHPYVVQAWVDAGEGRNDTPFLLVPPLSRLDPSVENVLRVMRVSDELPQDRESVFWINVKEIPEKVQQDNVLQLAIRTRIKLFYRPLKLAGSGAVEARKELKWSVLADRDGGVLLRVENPTPYHVTFGVMRVRPGMENIAPDMVPPYEVREYPLTSIGAPQAVSVEFAVINDYGGLSEEERIEVPLVRVESHPSISSKKRAF